MDNDPGVGAGNYWLFQKRAYDKLVSDVLEE